MQEEPSGPAQEGDPALALEDLLEPQLIAVEARRALDVRDVEDDRLKPGDHDAPINTASEL